jgi:hypothetical protein
MVTSKRTADEQRCLYAGFTTVVGRRHFCDPHEALLKGQPAAVTRAKEERRAGLTPEDPGLAGGALSEVGGALARRAVLGGELPTAAIRRHGPMLSACPAPGCSTLTMGGTCVEHDPPASVAFPRGRPHVAAHAVGRSRRDRRTGSTESCS